MDGTSRIKILVGEHAHAEFDRNAPRENAANDVEEIIYSSTIPFFYS